MATVSILSTAEAIVLPFCTLIPLITGFCGYRIWKQQQQRGGSTITERMGIWFMASSAIMIGLALFHVIFNITATGTHDPRIGLGAVAAAFCICMCAKMHFELAWVADEDLLLDESNETADYLVVDSDTLRDVGPTITSAQQNTRRRRRIATVTYAVVVFQSAFDGLVLKYNPNANDSGLQIAMFFISKLLESIVVSTALIHAAVKTSHYIFCICSFTLTVGLSTLAAYEIFSPTVPITIFEHWFFQILLGASGGVLLVLSFYYALLETRRAEMTQRSSGSTAILNLTFAAAFTATVLTGLFG